MLDKNFDFNIASHPRKIRKKDKNCKIIVLNANY